MNKNQRTLVVVGLVLLALVSVYIGTEMRTARYVGIGIARRLEPIPGAEMWKSAVTFALPILLGGLAGFVWLGKD